jgi:hypothetical protein
VFNRIGTFENFEAFTVNDPVVVQNTGTRVLYFRSGNKMFTLRPRASANLPTAEHIYKVFVTMRRPTMQRDTNGFMDGAEAQEEEVEAHRGGGSGNQYYADFVNINIASIDYRSTVAFMVHEGEAVVGAKFVSTVPTTPRF